MQGRQISSTEADVYDNGELDLFKVKAAAKDELGRIDGVQGFGVGDGSLRVYVQNAGVKQHLPSYFRGAPIECVVVGAVHAL
jgi:hypothetical protein